MAWNRFCYFYHNKQEGLNDATEDQRRNNRCGMRSGLGVAAESRAERRERLFAGRMSEARPQLGRSRLLFPALRAPVSLRAEG